ncbi:hypothetical protein [Acinetobacter beijerinckii]|uniref:Uncharacterized protein n=1 Tax=Acinetobacter beijerinckii ANC 3835 TaxID=1217649 RepID=N9E5H0_9GAMM|nr:hypothetical protein [Acinetobacter beijerinckii]ENW05738.1 hypothetical protein F934_01095 [Acinetobacter beijerinckii ANC 3835]
MPKYIALQSVGAFLPGEEIKGLNDERIQALLASGAIEEYKALEQTPSDDSADELEKLKGEVEDLKASNKQLETDKTTALGEVADLKASNTQLTEEKDKASGEVADLTAKIKKLEADLATATAKPAKEKSTADKVTPETK